MVVGQAGYDGMSWKKQKIRIDKFSGSIHRATIFDIIHSNAWSCTKSRFRFCYTRCRRTKDKNKRCSESRESNEKGTGSTPEKPFFGTLCAAENSNVRESTETVTSSSIFDGITNFRESGQRTYIKNLIGFLRSIDSEKMKGGVRVNIKTRIRQKS